jgi:hypothetical protein
MFVFRLISHRFHSRLHGNVVVVNILTFPTHPPPPPLSGALIFLHPIRLYRSVLVKRRRFLFDVFGVDEFIPRVYEPLFPDQDGRIGRAFVEFPFRLVLLRHFSPSALSLCALCSLPLSLICPRLRGQKRTTHKTSGEWNEEFGETSWYLIFN